MTQKLTLGNSIQPLRNVAALATLVKRLEKRGWGLPGMGVFHGPPGLGKSFACGHAAFNLDCIHITVDDTWTKKILLQAILTELRIERTGTIADMMMKAKAGLARAGRTLLMNEADDAVLKNLIPTIRHLHDGSEMPVILIGMERLPQKLKKWELVDSRIVAYVGAERLDMRDARLLAKAHIDKVEIDDALIAKILEDCNGSARLISNDLAHVVEQSRLMGQPRMTLDEWGQAPFLRGEAPLPREGM